MSEVVAADRSRLLRSKRAESSGIVTSRKRKLREFFAVCDNEEPLPTINLTDPDAPSASDAELQFLENCDIIKDRLFDEAHLPARRQLRSTTAKQQSQALPPPPPSPEPPRTSDVPRKPSKPQRKDACRKSRTTTPVAAGEEDVDRASEVGKQDGKVNGEGIPMQRSSSKGSQTDLPADSAAILDEIVDESLDNAIEKKPHHPSPPNTPAPPGALEAERIKTGVESKPGSPGVDPRKAVPVSAEEAAQLAEPLIYGQASHDEQHKAATVHLPPREVQEQRLRNNKGDHSTRPRKHQEQLSINLPGREPGRHAENLSSPGSTSHSATTPALHDASTDTSPDNEGSRYEAEQLEDKDEVPETPPELRPTPQEAAEKEEHDRILNAQIEISRAEILRSSPAAIDAQIRLEEQAAAESSQAAVDAQMEDVDAVVQDKPDGLTQEAGEVVQDMVDDQQEPAVPESEANTEPTGSQNSAKPSEIPDSEAPDTPVDAMDVDTTTVKDSFETNPSSEEAAGPSPVPEDTTPESSAKPAEESVEATPLTPAASTPQRMSSAAPPSNSERMTTRVASGAIRHKSVSEILGEIPRPNTASISDRSAVGKSATESGSNSPSRSSTPQSPGTRVRSLIERAKEKERSKLSTVVFAKQPTKRKSSDVALIANGKKKPHNEHDDYFMPLWRARPDAKNLQSIESLLQSAHKTVTTSNSYVPFLDNQTFRVLKRVKELQEMGKWSLRQPKRSAEPNRQTSHWDLVIQEAKWMRTDFREERKWKMTVARNLASACVEWVEASDEDRKLLQVKAIPPPRSLAKDIEMTDASSQAHSTPDLIASAEVDSPFEDLDDVPRFNLDDTVSPTAIFGLQDDDVIFGLRQSPATDKLLNELPIYGTPLMVPQVSFARLDIDPDAAWRRPVLPLSKYVEGRMELKSQGPPRKKSRYEYEDEDEDEDDLFGEPYTKRPNLSPQSTDVALFNPENKHIRDRIHAGHQFRPPSEYPMPLQSFFECRTGSQWTWAEDDELKTLVRSYTYNWSLISNMLTSKSMFSSGAERRTPWECFERWIHLEGLPSDMQKTHYFRAYNTRLEMAQRVLTEQAQAAPPQPNAAGQIVPPPRRRTTTTSVRVERRRNQKHLTLVDAMRKLAKKRETNLQKQQHAAGLAAMRKANEVAQPRGATHTPQDFSRLKFEREQQMQERVARYAQQQEINRRAAAQLARNGQNPQQGGPNGGQPLQMNRGPAPANGLNGQQPPNPNQLAVPGQNRPRAPMVPNPMAPVSMQNGLQVPPMHMNGVPQAQMQSRLPPPNPAPMLDMNTMAQSRRIADQQRHAVQLKQQGQTPQVHNSPPNMRNAQNVPNGAAQPFMPNPNMMPPFNPNGVSTPPAHGLNTPGSAGSPRLGQPGPQPLSNGMVPHVAAIEAQVRAKYPNATPDQHKTLVREHLKQIKGPSLNQAQLQQAAMNAAAGGNMNGVNGNGGQPRVPSGVENSPQLYAQMLRAQQERQQQQAQQAQAQQPQPQAQHQPHAQPQPQPQPQPTAQAQPVQQTQQTNPPTGPAPRAGSASSPGGT